MLLCLYGCQNLVTPQVLSKSLYKHCRESYHIVNRFPDYSCLKKGMTQSEVETILGNTGKVKLNNFCLPDKNNDLIMGHRIKYYFCIKEKDSTKFLEVSLGLLSDDKKEGFIAEPKRLSSKWHLAWIGIDKYDRTSKELLQETKYQKPEFRDKGYYKFEYKPSRSPVFYTKNEYRGFFMVKEFPDYQLLKKGMKKSEVEKILGETSSIDIDSFGKAEYEDDFKISDDLVPPGTIKYISWDNNIGWSFCIKNKQNVDFLDIFIGFERRTDKEEKTLPGWKNWRINSISIKKFNKSYQQLEKSKKVIIP